MNWQLWFVQLAGWPIFLGCVAVTIVGMLVLSVVMTRMTAWSAVRNMAIALVVLALVTALLLALVSVMSRTQ